MPNASPWTARIWAEYRANTITRAERDALLTLHSYRGAGGVCTPSHMTLADRAKVGTRTVQRALDAARELGLVISHERRRRAGWRWLRTSDAHRLVVPAADVQPRQWPRHRPVRTTRQPGGGDESQRSRSAQMTEMIAAAAGLPDLLAIRRASFRPMPTRI